MRNETQTFYVILRALTLFVIFFFFLHLKPCFVHLFVVYLNLLSTQIVMF